MASNRSLEPPFSPVLLAGLLMRPLPLAPLQALLDLALATMQRRHEKVFSRLAAQGEPLFLIDPVDLPAAFKLHFKKAGPKLTALRDKVAPDATAAIHGPFLTLLTLLEGRIDGDALFFTRELIVEGDTEAVVALRNAVDGAGIELTRDLPEASGRSPAWRVAACASPGASTSAWTATWPRSTPRSPLPCACAVLRPSPGSAAWSRSWTPSAAPSSAAGAP
jgi:predicted lipid carrier protein YhbT